MAKPKTRWVIILDRSGSMAKTKEATIMGLNEQIQQVKLKAEEHDVRCSLVTFNGEVFEHLWDVPANRLLEAQPADYVPIGSTAMRDAIGYTVQKLISTEGPDDKDTAYLIYVISDGDTNADNHYSPEAIAELQQGCQATGRWTFTYMGHDQKAMVKLAKETGTPLRNMAVWSNRTRGAAQAGFEHQKGRVNKFFDERAAGKLQVSDYASDQVGCVADFTDVQAKDVQTDIADPAPVTQVAVDLNEILNRQPRYESVHYEVSDGDTLFSNTAAVKWVRPETSQTADPNPVWQNATKRT